MGAAGGLLVILIEPADSLNGLEVLGGEGEQRLKERDESGIFGKKKVEVGGAGEDLGELGGELMGGAQEMAARIPGRGGFGREQAAQLHETEGDQTVEPGIGGGFQDAGRGESAEGAGEGGGVWGGIGWGSGGGVKIENLELLFEGLR